MCAAVWALPTVMALSHQRACQAVVPESDFAGRALKTFERRGPIRTAIIMRAKRTVKITIKREEFVYLRRHETGPSAWCSDCEANVNMLTPEEAAAVSGLSPRQIYRMVEARRLHFVESTEAAIFICPHSLELSSGEQPVIAFESEEVH
jgi:hypothetical protein